VHDHELPVIDTTASEVRVLLTSYHHRVAGYVPADTLALVVARQTPATLESGQAPARAKVTLEPGFAGELGEARSGERPVRVKALDLALRVPVAALGRVYEPRKPEPPAGATQALLESGTKLLDGPGGPALARLAEATSAHALGAADGAHQRVWLHHAGVTLEAWVDAKSVKPTFGLGTLGTFGFGGLGGYGRSHGDPIPLPKGTKLYASAKGPWIGLAVEESTVYERRSSGGDPANLRASFEAPLGAFGWPELWVDEATLREGRDHRSQRALREKRITVTKAAGPGDAKAAKSAFEGCRVTIAKCVEKAEARASGKVLTGAFDVKVERKDLQTVTSRVSRPPSKDAELTSCLEAATLAAAPPRRAGEAVKGTFTATITIGKPVAKP
jgi:hypothetical protein